MRRRIIINTDAKNEADDQYAIVQGLLSPSIELAGLVAAHFGNRRNDSSMLESRAEIDLILELMDLSGRVPVANGAPHGIPDATTPIDSEGARLILAEAAKPGPLFVAFLGPLTDMASALLLDPSIAQNPDLTVVWVGGAPYDGPYGGYIDGEFNASNDVHAANVVLQSGARVWQIPWTVYSMVSVGYAELDQRVAPYGELGRYLVDQLKEWNATYNQVESEYRSLGDNPAIGVVLNPGGAVWRNHPVRVIDEHARLTTRVVEGRTVRVADSVDVRWLLEDLFAKIQAFDRSRASRDLESEFAAR